MDTTLSIGLLDWRLVTKFEDRKRYHELPNSTECWESVDELGVGTYGRVWKEQCLSNSSSSPSGLRAVKHISKQQSLAKASKREIEALTTFSRDNMAKYQQHFVQILGWFEDDSHWYIAMEFIEHGNLHQYIEQGVFKDPEAEPEAALITAQIAQALFYMHTNDLVHRDLKPLNILVSNPGPAWHVKVADFGITKNLANTASRTQGIGTPDYMAPEIWEDSRQYSFAIDVWALGAIAFCMRTGSPPFNPIEVGRYRKDPSLFPILKLSSSTHPCITFIMGAMAAVADERPTIADVLLHPWLTRKANNANIPHPLPRTTSSTSLGSQSLVSSIESIHLEDTWSTKDSVSSTSSGIDSSLLLAPIQATPAVAVNPRNRSRSPAPGSQHECCHPAPVKDETRPSPLEDPELSTTHHRSGSHYCGLFLGLPFLYKLAVVYMVCSVFQTVVYG